MSKRHQSSRRHSYGRRQHESNERPERSGHATDLIESGVNETVGRWMSESLTLGAAPAWLQIRRID